MHQNQRKYDVIIVGAGLSGLSTAWHLYATGIRSILILSDGPKASASAPPMALAGFYDHYTRFTHRLGIEDAAELWGFSKTGFLALKKFCQKYEVPYSQGSRIRFAKEEFEVQEMQTSLEQNPFGELKAYRGNEKKQHDFGKILADSVPFMIDEGRIGISLAPNKLLEALEAELDEVAILKQQVQKLRSAPEGVEVHADQIYHGEMVVIAGHLKSKALLPNFNDVLIPVSDQWQTYSPEKPEDFIELAGTVFTAHNSHFWGCIGDKGQLTFGGCRFLRKNAGIGSANISPDPKIAEELDTAAKEIFKEYFQSTQPKASSQGAMYDIYPCDELPIIGPVFGDNRLLFASGFYGSGLSSGFYAGKCMADIVKNGKSATLPRFLGPERLRSLSK